jgi:hypothetical protein
MAHESKLARFAGRFLAVVVVLLTAAVVVPAVQLVSTPNAVFVSYNLAAGATSAAITPVANQSVLVMGTQTAFGYRGVGQVALLRVPSSFLEWTGIESPSNAALTSGDSGTPGTHIVFLDFSHLVQIEVHTTDTFVIHNGNTITMTGNVTMIW